MKLYKKAFTLVEMSMVLVIIGVISIIYVSITNNINNLKIKREVAKVIEINTALNSYLVTYRQLPSLGTGNTTIPISSSRNAANTLANKNLLNTDTFRIDRRVAGNGNYTWTFVPCSLDDPMNITFDYKSYFLSFTTNGQYPLNTSICLSLGGIPNSNNWNQLILAYRLFGEYEVSLDDANLLEGSGRIVNGYYTNTGTSTFPIPPDYYEENKVAEWNKMSSNTIGTTNVNLRYAIMLR